MTFGDLKIGDTFFLWNERHDVLYVKVELFRNHHDARKNARYIRKPGFIDTFEYIHDVEWIGIPSAEDIARRKGE